MDNSSLTPSQSFEYLGLAFRSDLEVVCPADHLLVKLQRELTTYRSQIFVTLRNFQFLCWSSWGAFVCAPTILAVPPVEPLSPLYQLTCEGDVKALRCAPDLVGHNLATAESAADQSVSRSLPVHRHFTGVVERVAQRSRTSGEAQTVLSI